MLKTVSLPFFNYNNNYSNDSGNNLSLDILSRAAELAVITGFSEAGRRRKSLILGAAELYRALLLLNLRLSLARDGASDETFQIVRSRFEAWCSY